MKPLDLRLQKVSDQELAHLGVVQAHDRVSSCESQEGFEVLLRPCVSVHVFQLVEGPESCAVKVPKIAVKPLMVEIQNL